MSVQLILFPQTYEGGVSVTSGDPNEVLVNGLSFQNLSSAPTYQTTSSFSAIPFQFNTAAPPTIPNTWYRMRYGLSGVYPDYPTDTGGKLIIDDLATQSASGIYQRLGNLAVGSQYTVRIDFDSFPTGSAVKIYFIGTLNGGAWVINSPSYPGGLGYAAGGVPGMLNYTFTNWGSDVRFFLMFNDTGIASTVSINSISLIPATVQPSGTINYLGDGQVICDLYEEEEIPLTLRVEEFANAAENVQSYSKPFMLPGTKRNNQIFENLFEVTRSSLGVSGPVTFNPYAKTKAILKQDSLVIFEGWLKVIDIQDKEDEISYNVNLYSTVITLSDTLKDKKFKDLDFSELEHSYDKHSIKNSWKDPSDEVGLPLTNPLPTTSFAYEKTNQPAYGASQTNVLKYPFCDWEHNWLIADGYTGNSANLDMPELTSLQQAFRPFIQIKYIIDMIFAQDDVPFSYTSDFFDTDNFKGLFMDFNWGSTPDLITGYTTFGTELLTNVSTTSFANLHWDVNRFTDSAFGWDSTNYKFVGQSNNQNYNIDYTLAFTATGGSGDTISMQIVHKDSTGTVIDKYDERTTTPSGLFGGFGGNANITIGLNDTIEVQWKTGSAGTWKQDIDLANGWTMPWSELYVTIGAVTVTTGDLLQSLRGDLGQWEFLKGIFTMFNLITIPDEENPENILIEPYGDIFVDPGDINSGNMSDLTLKSRGIAHNWTDKIDISQIKLVPLNDLEKTLIFKFEEDEEDHTFMNYKLNTQNHLYGSKIFGDTSNTLSTGLQGILQGSKEIVASPFAATIPKALGTQFDDFIVPALYSYNADDGTSQGFNNKPRIMFNDGITVMSKSTYYIPDQNDLSSENKNEYLQFSHFNKLPSNNNSTDFHFGVCQYFPGVSTQGTVDNLFGTYWLPYFNELYNADTRIMTIKVNLSPSDINTFRFYDTVFIKNREFRVNKIDYKPNDLSTVEFILIP